MLTFTVITTDPNEIVGPLHDMTSEVLAMQERDALTKALLQSEKLAAVGRLASSISHEINNPLESVTNLLFLARQSDSLPEAQQFLDLADQELRRMSAIATQTLKFNKQATEARAVSCATTYGF